MAEAPAQIRSARFWTEMAALASRDFMVYASFVRGHLAEDHHEVIAERLQFGTGYDLILGPPDTAKTEWGVMHVEWCLGRNCDMRWLIASEVVSGIASQIVSQIGETLESNERYHMTFGDLRSGSKLWSSYALDLRPYLTLEQAKRQRKHPTPAAPFPWLGHRGRRPGLRGNSVKAVGWRTGYTGVRADALLGDDLVSDRSSRSEVLTEAVFRTLHQKLIARLTGKSRRVILLGQRWQPGDLFGRLIERGTVVYDNNPDMLGLTALRESIEIAA